MSDEPQAIEQESTPPRAARWSRVHTIWTLIIVSLIPGVVIAAFRDHWEDLPNGVQMTTYVTCAILIVAAVGLILYPGDKDTQ
jgi:hypothetical protein